MSGVYVFALTSRRASPFMVQGHRIEFVKVDNLFAAVERRDAAPAISEQELRVQHAIVTAIFRRVEDLLPVRFGAWMDRRELAEVVGSRKAAIMDALDRVRGRVQMTIRFPASPAELPRQPSPISRPETGTAYLEARRAAVRDLPGSTLQVTEAVRDFVVAERISRGSEALPTAIYHLISRIDIRRYQSATRSFQSSLVTVSGPWPPFAFVPDQWP
jgi:Gas vesicle synthesis protein GvpL/GvpF